MARIILAGGGSELIPPRFWPILVCEEEEFTDKMKEYGWRQVELDSYRGQFLTADQRAYLNYKDGDNNGIK